MYYTSCKKKNGHWVSRNWDQQFQTLNTTTSQKKEQKFASYTIQAAIYES